MGVRGLQGFVKQHSVSKSLDDLLNPSFKKQNIGIDISTYTNGKEIFKGLLNLLGPLNQINIVLFLPLMGGQKRESNGRLNVDVSPEKKNLNLPKIFRKS